MSIHFDLTRSIIIMEDLFKNGKFTELPISSDKPEVKILCSCTLDHFLAYSDTDKGVHIYDYKHHVKLAVFQMPHRVSVLRFVQSPKLSLLVGDRSGNVFQLTFSNQVGSDGAFHKNITEGDSKDCLLLGHVSMLSHLDVFEQSGHIATGDRDEKIRISRFPNAYEIQSFCLGHEKFIAQIKFLPHDLLLSGSGDGTIRLWRPSSGDCIQVLNCSELIQTLTGTAEKDTLLVPVTICVFREVVLVAFHRSGDILLLKLDASETKLVAKGCLSHRHSVLDMQLISEHLVVVLEDPQAPVLCYLWDEMSSHFEKTSHALVDSDLCERIAREYVSLEEKLKALTKMPTGRSGLDIYLQKKEARIQTKKARMEAANKNAKNSGDELAT